MYNINKANFSGGIIMNIFDAIESLLEYGEKHSLFEKEDRVYCRNLILDVLRLDSMEEAVINNAELQDILKVILDYACENGIETVVCFTSA